MKNVLSALLLLFSAVMLNAQDAAPQSHLSSVLPTWKTKGEFNGHFWKQLSEEEKRIYLFGWSGAVEQVTVLVLGSDFERYKTTSKLFWPRALTVDEVRSALTAFYETAENSPISISGAIFLISKRSEGASATEMQELIAHLRENATK